MRAINGTGLSEIREFLATNHKNAATMTDEMIGAWASDAEFQLAEGNPPTIEIRAWDSVTGHTCTYTVSNEGVGHE